MRLPQTLLVSFQTEFGPHKNAISQLHHEIQDEASLSSKQAQQQENKFQAREPAEARSHRKVRTSLTSPVNHNQAQEEKMRLEKRRQSSHKKKMLFLNNLSTYDHQKTYKQIRKSCVPGTLTWILEHPELVAWKGQASTVLWCSGRCEYAVRLFHMQR